MSEFIKIDPSTASDDQLMIAAIAIIENLDDEEIRLFALKIFSIFLLSERIPNSNFSFRNSFIAKQTSELCIETLKSINSNKIILKINE